MNRSLMRMSENYWARGLAAKPSQTSESGGSLKTRFFAFLVIPCSFKPQMFAHTPLRNACFHRRQGKSIMQIKFIIDEFCLLSTYPVKLVKMGLSVYKKPRLQTEDLVQAIWSRTAPLV